MQRTKLAGMALVILALLANPFLLIPLTGLGGEISHEPLKIVIIVAESVISLMGACLLWKPKNYRIVLVLGILLVMWLPADLITTRIVAPPVPYRQEDALLHHSLVPNSSGIFTSAKNEFTMTYFINSAGLRNPEIPKNKTKIRILMLGDSFTEGRGVNYSDTVSKKLNDYLGDRYEVINAGVSSYSPTPEYLYLVNRGMKLEPDIVILNYDVSDIQDDAVFYPDYAKYDRNGELASLGERTPPQALFRNTFIIIDTLFFEEGNPEFDREFHTRLDNCSGFEKEWNASYKYLAKIKQYLDERNVSFYVTIYPYGHQVAANQWVEGRKMKHFDSDKVYPFAIADCFQNHAYGENFTVLNLLSDFREAAKDKKLYYDIDFHMTPAGYDLMARGIYERLVKTDGWK